jgi:hypothetical protein
MTTQAHTHGAANGSAVRVHRVFRHLVPAVAVLLFASQCGGAEEDSLPLGPMPDPKLIETHCRNRTLSPGAVKHVIAAASYRFGPFQNGPEWPENVQTMFARGGGALVHYRPGVPTMVPRLTQDASGHPLLSKRPAMIEAIAIGDGPATWNGKPVKGLFVHLATSRGWFSFTSSDLESICVRRGPDARAAGARARSPRGAPWLPV